MKWLYCLSVLLHAAAYAKVLPKDDDVCSTAACEAIATDYLASIDVTVDPCEDFYMYTCGNFIANNELPPGSTRFGQLDIISQKVNAFIYEELQKPIGEEELQPIKYLKNHYQACVDNETTEAQGLKPFLPYVSSANEFGGWPLIQETYSAENYDPMVVEAKSKKLLGFTSSLLGCGVSLDSLDTSRSVFFLFGPVMPLRNYDDVGSVQRYKTDMKKTARAFINEQGFDISRDELNSRVEKAFAFEEAIARYSNEQNVKTMPEFGPDQRKELTKLQELIPAYSLNMLEILVPVLNLREYFETLYEDLDYNFPAHENVIYTDINYLRFLQNLLLETPVEDQANYHYWRYVRKYRKFGPRSIAYNEPESIDVPCAYYAATGFFGLDWAMARIYVEAKFTDQARAEVNDLVDNLKVSFKQLVDESEWMDEKEVAKEKADYMVQNLGYPDWILDNEMFMEYHKELRPLLADTKLENFMGVAVWKVNSNLAEMKTPMPRDTFIMSPALVNAAYSPSLNSITFPAAILQAPNYDVDHPKYLNYGAIGVIIGHEITHGFDNGGRMFDKTGNLVQWWSEETIDAFNEHAQCFVDQYDNFTIPELVDTLGEDAHVDGSNTLGENIADNGGIREAFRAYKLHQAKAEGLDPLLPGMEGYTREQMFFLSFGHIWCTLEKALGFQLDLQNNVHSPARYRVLGSAMNSEDFSEAFRCPAGTAMNPAKKCLLW